VHLEASTKPHVHQKFEIFWTNIASTMACPNFKNGPNNGLDPLGLNYIDPLLFFINFNFRNELKTKNYLLLVLNKDKKDLESTKISL
jgi:hypothetical protein